MSAVGDEMPGYATRRQVIAGVLVPRGVRAGTDAGRRRQWLSPHCLHPKSDGPHFRLREKWRRSGARAKPTVRMNFLPMLISWKPKTCSTRERILERVRCSPAASGWLH